MKLKNQLRLSALILALLARLPSVSAGPVTFTIDPARSSIALSGNVVDPALTSSAFSFATQGTGSLTTHYTGTIVADLEPPNIQFPGGSFIRAETNGTWKPALGGGTVSNVGMAPADYGGEINQFLTVTAYFAGRNFQLDATSPAASVSNGGFNAGVLTVTFLTAPAPAPTVDYNVSIPLDSAEDTTGTSPLIGAAANSPNTAHLTNAFNITNAAQKLTLALPVAITNVSTNSGDIITVILTGTVVATAPASDWPLEISANLQNGQLTLTWPSIPGQNFTVQTTQNLKGPWSAASGALTIHANTTTWAGAASDNLRFYRVQGLY